MDQQDILEFMGKLSYVIAVIGLIVVTALIWYKITGHSPTADQMIITLESAILAAIFGFIYYFADFKGATRSDLKGLKEDTSSVKQLTSKMQMKFLEMEIKLSNLETDVAQIKKILTKRKTA